MEQENIIWKLKEKWKWSRKYKDLATEITKWNEKFDRLCLKAASDYFMNFRTKIEFDRANSLNDLFEQMQDIISDIVESNISVTKTPLESHWLEKMKYLIDNHLEYFEKLEPKKTKMHDVLRAAEYYIMDDFLYEFHDEFKKEFTNELELEQQNQISM
ncbi:hypothetical protein [Mycoplasmopsis pullorum]|uniref:hypothetical protein n=1 Tax=Mycoplasmopsis pullorum TaxID=48003 RepID=UPI0011180024|nr:hypothetical protein [Mycoplasmopsis pullorum]TNK81582.1 hypothetical protein C4M94_03720 [Mycoplasmopsis pullorum]